MFREDRHARRSRCVHDQTAYCWGPDLTLFVVDAALRLSDSVVPKRLPRARAAPVTSVATSCRARGVRPRSLPLRSQQQEPDLMITIGRGIAEGPLVRGRSIVQIDIIASTNVHAIMDLFGRAREDS